MTIRTRIASIEKNIQLERVDVNKALIVDGFGLKTADGVVELELPKIENKGEFAHENLSNFTCMCKEVINGCNEADIYTEAVNNSMLVDNFDDWFQTDEFVIKFPDMKLLDNFVYLKDDKWCSLWNYISKSEFISNYEVKKTYNKLSCYHVYPILQLVDREFKQKRFKSVITIKLNIRKNKESGIDEYTLYFEGYTILNKDKE
jgi:hypothetical protein